ncbi:MAG: hypothetical protein IPO69_20455 [Saprospiraceae bacterium]|nr:hypothetical protein [Saprospiraceae bacterium]
MIDRRAHGGEDRTECDKLIYVVRHEDYNAQRTSMELPLNPKVIAAVKNTKLNGWCCSPLWEDSSLFLFEKYLDAILITLPIM